MTSYRLIAVLLLFPCIIAAQTQIGGGVGAGSPVPGVFNSNFDPPLFQNYTLTTAGAQTGINLTANPIDTQQISWRPVGFTFSVIESVAYGNGDLHTANANWAYQTGSFQVSSFAIYGSSAGNTLAYRSDGPTAQATEWAQETMVITGSNGTQIAGPCVRVSTAALTGYCLNLANNLYQIVSFIAGAGNILGTFNASAPVTGDVVAISASGTTITGYRNGVVIGSATDANIATGSTGIYSAANTAVNGFSNFQSGTGPYPICTVALDTSPDGSAWTTGGSIPSQSCTTPGSFQSGPSIANFVRVNLLTFSGTNVAVVYSGRLAPAANNAAAISNGQWVQAGQVLWAQHTTQGTAGSAAVHQSINILQANGVTKTVTWDVSNCTAFGGEGTGYLVTQSGVLQGFTTYITSSGIPQGYDLVNLYILNSMPAGGGQTSCVATLAPSQIGTILGTWYTGSFLPVSFVGTTSTFQGGWSFPGYTTTISVSNPAAGAEWSSTLSATARTCIQSVSFTAASGSTGINPVLVLSINGSKLVYAPATQQGSGTTQTYSFSPGAVAETVTAGSTLYHIVPFNNGQAVCYNSGLSTATIGTLTTTINGTTQYSNISILTQVQQDNN